MCERVGTEKGRIALEHFDDETRAKLPQLMIFGVLETGNCSLVMRNVDVRIGGCVSQEPAKIGKTRKNNLSNNVVWWHFIMLKLHSYAKSFKVSLIRVRRPSDFGLKQNYLWNGERRSWVIDISISFQRCLCFWKMQIRCLMHPVLNTVKIESQNASYIKYTGTMLWKSL